MCTTNNKLPTLTDLRTICHPTEKTNFSNLALSNPLRVNMPTSYL